MRARQRRKARGLPRSGDDNGWYRTLPPAPPPRRLAGHGRAHWAIVGAGCCGLAVARQLAAHRPDDRIVLIEAERVGFGASGRNAGFMLDIHSHGLVKEVPVLRRNMQLWQAGLDQLRRLVRTYRIRCDWSDWGRLYGAVATDGETCLDGIVQAYDRLGVPYARLDRAAMARATGTTFYAAGLKAFGSALVQPAALMRGLAATLPANVEVYEESPVHEIAKGPPHELVSASGTLRAEGLILTSGVFLSDLGWFRHRYVPIATYASLTRPLDEAERAGFEGIGEFGLLPASANGSTVRLTRDGRILMRNWLTYDAGKTIDAGRLARVRARHRDAIGHRWPDLGQVEIVATWGGYLAFTRNDGGVFGRLDDGVYGLVACDVSPVTRGTAAGRLLADYIVGADSALLDLQLGIPKGGLVPPEPLLGWVVNRRIRSLRARGAEEL